MTTTAPSSGVDHAIETELFARDGELAVDRQNKERIEFPGAHELGDVRDVNEEKCLKNLRDDLVRADEQHDFPFRPVTDPVDLAEDDAEEKNLAAKPKHLDDHPEDEVRLETHLADERVAQHDRVDFDVTAHGFLLSFKIWRVNRASQTVSLTVARRMLGG